MSENQMNEKNESVSKKKLSKGKITLIALVCALVVIVGGFFVYSATYDRVYPGVWVAGIDIGGLGEDDVCRRLDMEYGNQTVDTSITFACGENSVETRLSDIDARLDDEKIVEVAMTIGRNKGFFGRVFAMVGAMFKTTEVPVSVKVDKDALEEIIRNVSADLEIPMTETTYEVDGNNLTIIKGKPGKMVDREKVVLMIAEAFVNPEINRIDLKIEDAEPKTIDLDDLYQELTQPVTNAEYALKDGEVVIIPPKGGLILEKGELKKALESNEKRYTIAVQATEPDVTAEELKGLLFRDVMASYSSDFSTSSAARASNVELTARRINGCILMPGDVFSYDKTVGRRTAANGYKAAGVYIGNRVESGIGGGICQTSSTLYCAALYANLEIVQRSSHSLPVSYVPAGMDATIAEGYIDLEIKNNTAYPVKIQAVVSGRKLTCSLLGVKDHDISVEVVNSTTATYAPEISKIQNPDIPVGYKKVVSSGDQGYSVASTRIVKSKGQVIKNEKLTNSLYRATNTEIEVNPADMETPVDALLVYSEEEAVPEQDGEVSEPIETTENQVMAETVPESANDVTVPESANDVTVSETVNVVEVLMDNDVTQQPAGELME